MKLSAVKKKLEDLFVYYASFGERMNTTSLKSVKYHKLLTDAGIEESIQEKETSGKPKMSRHTIDIVFKRSTKNTLTFP